MTALYSNPLSGEMPTAAQLATWLPIVARRTSDSAAVNNSAGLVNDSQLFVPLASGSPVYEFTAAIKYVTNATANFQYAWSGPAGYGMQYDLLGTMTGTFGLYARTDSDVPAMSPGNGVLRMSGLIYGAGAGNLQLRWAQATANLSNTFVGFASYIKLTQIA